VDDLMEAQSRVEKMDVNESGKEEAMLALEYRLEVKHTSSYFHTLILIFFDTLILIFCDRPSKQKARSFLQRQRQPSRLKTTLRRIKIWTALLRTAMKRRLQKLLHL